MKTQPDHHDADIVLKLYDLRREAVMRESRSAMAQKFWPKTHEELLAFTRPEHPLNAAFRQTVSYWEMAYSMARHGIVHADFLAENAGEGLFLFARAHPFLEAYRRDVSPMGFLNAEWIATNCASGRRIFAMMRTRIAKMMEGK